MEVFGVARFLLNESGSLATMKLQKLVYYSQAYHLVKFGTPLFRDRIEAWANGPVVKSLYSEHKGLFVISKGFFDRFASRGVPSSTGEEAMNRVLDRLGGCSGSDLSALIHSEKPWIDARKGCTPFQRSSNEITTESMRSYYSDASASNPAFADRDASLEQSRERIGCPG